jgi:hypothetical protein
LRKTHVLCRGTKKFAITRHIQILLCTLGQSRVFEEAASQLLKELIGLETSAIQIQRVSEYYGGQLDGAVNRNITTCIAKLDQNDPGGSKDSSTYVMIDGSMVFTREEKRKEMKLARIFKQDSITKMSECRTEIRKSVYVSHLGGVDAFFPKLERHMSGYKNLVIIGDGARWIWNWAESNYPGAVQILDFFHVKEKFVLLSKQLIKEQDRQQWVKDYIDLILNDQVEQVIQKIKNLRCTNNEAKEMRQKTINYCIEHEDRMLYKTYRDKGLLIGSGPVEAAHRSVLQTRMKLSGQKWSIIGANAIANLRCL